MTASQTEEFTQRTLMAIMTHQATIAAEQKTVDALVKSLADAHGIPASYPPAE